MPICFSEELLGRNKTMFLNTAIFPLWTQKYLFNKCYKTVQTEEKQQTEYIFNFKYSKHIEK